MNREQAKQFAYDLFKGAKNRETKQSIEHGTDAEIQIVQHKAREIWQLASDVCEHE